MAGKIKILSIAVVILGVVAIVFGSVFVGLGIAKANFLKEQMRVEKVTYLLPKDEVAKGNVVDTAAEATKVSNQIREHRSKIAPTYAALTAANPDGKYDPTNPNDLKYSQALTMENGLNLAILGFGVTQVVTATGIFMLVIGFAVVAAGIALFVVSRRIFQGMAGLQTTT